MFDVVQRNKRIAQGVLALVTLPFAFFGMESYFSQNMSSTVVAEVAGVKISEAEFDNALREQIERQRQRLGGKVDPKLLDSPEMRQQVLDGMVATRVMARYLVDKRMGVSDLELQESIRKIEAFHDDKGFSLQRYQQVLRGQGMNETLFENSMRRDLTQQQVLTATGNTGLTARASAERMLMSQLEKRELRVMSFAPAAHAAGIVPGEAELKKVYDESPTRFEQPARIKVAYVVLDGEALAERIKLSDEEIRAWYDGHQDRYAKPEERRASHILFEVDPKADAAAVEKVRADAQKTLDELRAAPGRFAELAKARSRDPGSAAQGGDLGFFGRGAMVPEFEQAAFSLDKGQLSELVKTDFGFHIIKVTEVRPGSVTPFESVKGEIVTQLKRERAARQFSEAAEEFSNTVYEQPDSLAPVVERFGLKLRQTDWIAQGAAGLGDNVANERLMSALFSNDAIANHRNTEAVELGGGRLVSARVLEHEPARRLSFEQARPAIEKEIIDRRAGEQARRKGEEALASLKKGGTVDGKWSPSRTVTRGENSLPKPALEAVFHAETGTLPAYVGLATPDGGYAVYAIDKVTKPELQENDPRLNAALARMNAVLGQQDMDAFLKLLEQRYKLEVRATALRPKAE